MTNTTETRKQTPACFNLKDKVVVLTGGVGILGKTFSEGLASEGAKVVVLDLSKEAVTNAASELESNFKIKSLGIACDLTNQAAVNDAVGQIVAEFGRIDVLHNNAATKTGDLKAFFESFENYSLETWREVMAVNIDGMFLMSQAVGKQMLKQGGGSMIQMSSVYGIRGADQRIYEGSDYLGGPISLPAVYSASKAAVLGLTRHLAAYWADKNIRVNAIVPGGMSSGQNGEFHKKYAARVPMNRMGEPSELLGALFFLASDASSYVTGQEIVVDGGLSAW